MTRPIFVIVAACLILLGACSAHAQQAGKMHRIGFLHPGNIDRAPSSRPFFQGLRDLGYVEGRNIIIERRSAKGLRDRLAEMAADLVARKVDLIFVCCQPGVDAARKATSTIPIVVGTAADYVAQGLVKKLSSPGGNVTGLSTIYPGM